MNIDDIISKLEQYPHPSIAVRIAISVLMLIKKMMLKNHQNG